MVFDAFGGFPIVRGLLFALAGVGFWVGGLLGVNWLWKHYRGEASD
ncbi:hypothetical protein [Natronomonas marina]|nr:hypothetical protein [Natronomonas marina]